MEVEAIKAKLEKKIADDEKHAIRDRVTFEKHFGKQPRPSEEKVKISSIKIIVC